MSKTAVKDISEVQFFDVETLKYPYETYALLREKAPVFHVPMLNMHIVTRYDLVREAIKDTETYSSSVDQFFGSAGQQQMIESAPASVQKELRAIYEKMIPQPPTLISVDEPVHTKYRSIVAHLFTVSQIRKAEDAVQKVIDETLASFSALGQAEFVTAFANPVPLRIIGDRLGIPEEERSFFDEAATAAAAGLRFNPIGPEEMVRRAELAVQLQDLLVTLIEEARVQPEEHMISILANGKLEGEDRLLTHGECVSILNQFLVAGHETTSSTFGWGMLMLCQNTDIQDQVRSDASLTKIFVEEALRLEAPVQGLPRQVTKDTELGGYPLKKGELIMLRFGAANRDESQFECAHMMDLQRPKAKAGAQLAFGSGVHFCPGAPLARQELTLGFPSLLQKMRNLRLSSNHDIPTADPSFLLRNLPELHIEWDPE